MPNKRVKKWRRIASEVVFDHRWYKVQRNTFLLPRGKIIDDYFVGLFSNIVLIVAITARGEIVLIRQYKAGADAITLEVPAGYLDGDEKPLNAAQRELLEETGYRAKHWEHLGFFYSNPTKERGNGNHIFLATEASRVAEQDLDSNEDIEIELVKKQDVLKKIETNEINVAGSAAALLLAFEKIKTPSQTSRKARGRKNILMRQTGKS